MTKYMADYMSLHCNTCGKDVYKNKEDYFMLKDEVWEEVCNNDYIAQTHILCKRCTEHFLGRNLTKEDYTKAPVNDFFEREKNDD